MVSLKNQSGAGVLAYRELQGKSSPRRSVLRNRFDPQFIPPVGGASPLRMGLNAAGDEISAAMELGKLRPPSSTGGALPYAGIREMPRAEPSIAAPASPLRGSSVMVPGESPKVFDEQKFRASLRPRAGVLPTVAAAGRAVIEAPGKAAGAITETLAPGSRSQKHTLRHAIANPPAAGEPAGPTPVGAATSAGNGLREWKPGTGIFVPEQGPVAVDGTRVLRMTPGAQSAQEFDQATRDYDFVQGRQLAGLRDPRDLAVGPDVGSTGNHLRSLAPNGGVVGRSDRAAALQRNQDTIAKSNYLRTPVHARQRQDAVADQERAGANARYIADRGVDAAAAQGEGRQSGAQGGEAVYRQQVAKQLEELAKQAGAEGDSEREKFLREQAAKYADRGVPTKEKNKKTGDYIMRDPTEQEVTAWVQTLDRATRQPVPQLELRKSAGKALMGFTNMTPEFKEKYQKNEALKRAADMAYMYYQTELDEVQKRQFEQSPVFKSIQMIRGA